jgi:hypothetical protein
MAQAVNVSVSKPAQIPLKVLFLEIIADLKI